MPYWSKNSTTLENGVTYVNQSYKDSTGRSQLSTITTTNTTGYRDVVEGSTRSIGEGGIKGLSYAVQNDGKITYRYTDPAGGSRQFNSIQDLANAQIPGYNAATTKQIKDGMQRNLSTMATQNGAGTPTGRAPGAGDTSTPSGDSTAIKGTKTSGFGDFRYPADIGSTKQDVIKFTMLEYQPPGLGTLGSSGGSQTLGVGGKRDANRKGIGTVVLPIPSGITDTNSANWAQNELNAFQAALAAGAYKGITEGLGSGIAALGASAENATQDPGTKKAIGAMFTAGAMQGDQASILSRAEGQVINPNMELLFNGPQLRPFSFSFKMSARNKEEGQTIIKILNFFKRGMSPIKSESNLFLKSPHTFRIQYLHLGEKGKDHPYIGKIKECALQSCTINYTPEGQYATFHDGVLVSYEMQLSFTELEPIFNSDYEGLEGIGY